MTTGVRQLRREYGKAWKSPNLGADAKKTIESGAHGIASRNNPSYGELPAEGLIDLRKMADNNANFVQGKTPAGLDLASQEFRTAAENQLGRKMAGKPSAKRYDELKDKMAELAPVLEAFNEKAISNYSWAPELISGVVGSASGLGPLPIALTAARRIRARRYPGIAPALYETGRAAGSKVTRKTGKAALDLGRATYGALREDN